MKPPISDPFGSPPETQNHRIFRVDFWRAFVGYFCFFVLVLSPFLMSVLEPIRDDREIFVFPSILIGAALVSAALGLIYPVQISKSGLRGINSWGAKREVEWPEIQRARFVWLFHPYVIISTSRKRNFIWLPLYLSDQKGFARAVEEWAPEENPLRLWIQKRGL